MTASPASGGATLHGAAICGKCGGKLPSGALFCGACGTRAVAMQAPAAGSGALAGPDVDEQAIVRKAPLPAGEPPTHLRTGEQPVMVAPAAGVPALAAASPQDAHAGLARRTDRGKGSALTRTRMILTSSQPAITRSAFGRDIVIQQRHVSWVGLGLVSLVVALVMAPSAAPAGPADQVGRFLGSLSRGDLVAAAAYVDPNRVDSTDPKAMYELVLGNMPGTLPDKFGVSVQMIGSPLEEVTGAVATVSFTGATSVDYSGSRLSPTVADEFHLRRVSGRWLITDSVVR